MKASMVLGEIPLPSEDLAKKEQESLGAAFNDSLVTCEGKIVFGQCVNSVNKFSQTILGLIKADEIL